MKNYYISIVVPVYKEEKNIKPFVDRAAAVMEKIGCDYEIIFCLDPSPDKTKEAIEEQIKTNSSVKLIQFSRRFGQPTATLAGIYACKGDACVVIDVDLQDPPELIETLISKWEEGSDVVYAQRNSRKGETFIKKIIAGTGYWLINKYSEVRIPVNTGDFRLMDRRVIDELCRIKEHHGFLRGMVADVGFKQTAVLYDRDERVEGKGNYNRLTGSWRIGLNGLFCYSYTPLAFLTGFSSVFVFITCILTIYAIIQKVLTGHSQIPFTIVVLLLIGGIQMFFISVVGEYIGRIYEEIKNKPRYIVDLSENLSDEQKARLDQMRKQEGI